MRSECRGVAWSAWLDCPTKEPARKEVRKNGRDKYPNKYQHPSDTQPSVTKSGELRRDVCKIRGTVRDIGKDGQYDESLNRVEAKVATGVRKVRQIDGPRHYGKDDVIENPPRFPVPDRVR